LVRELNSILEMRVSGPIPAFIRRSPAMKDDLFQRVKLRETHREKRIYGIPNVGFSPCVLLVTQKPTLVKANNRVVRVY
jgi:hypothetical protein